MFGTDNEFGLRFCTQVLKKIGCMFEIIIKKVVLTRLIWSFCLSWITFKTNFTISYLDHTEYFTATTSGSLKTPVLNLLSWYFTHLSFTRYSSYVHNLNAAGCGQMGHILKSGPFYLKCNNSYRICSALCNNYHFTVWSHCQVLTLFCCFV